MTRDPMKAVTDGKWESVAVFKRGFVAGSCVYWTLQLECGHEVGRKNAGGKLRRPEKVRCEKCGNMARAALRDERTA
jgi:hypothetical protein